jgi:hypothetical protein
MRYRSLISTGLLFRRELNIHGIDHGSNSAGIDFLRAEMSRRVCWYLIATEW